MGVALHRPASFRGLLRPTAVWLAGALLVLGFVLLWGPGIVYWGFVQTALRAKPWDSNPSTERLAVSQWLEAPFDLAGVRERAPTQLLRLLETNKRPEVRRAAAKVLMILSSEPPGHPIPGLSRFRADPDPEISDLCLIAAVYAGDHAALLLLHDRFRASDLAPAAEFWAFGNLLWLGRFREAGDEFACRVQAAEGDVQRRVADMMEGFLNRHGWIGSRGVWCDGRFITADRPSRVGDPDLSEEDQARLARELARIWEAVRESYQSIHDHRPGSWYGPRTVHWPEWGPGHKGLILLFLVLEALWAAGFWTVRRVRNRRRRDSPSSASSSPIAAANAQKE